MKGTIVYVTGSPGFKPAVITKLGGQWIHNARDIGEEIVGFQLPDKVTFAHFKSLIGKDILSDHNVQFLDEPPSNPPSDQFTHIPGPIKMSFWVNPDSNLGRKGG